LLLFEYATLNGGEHSLLTLLPRLRDSGEYAFSALAPADGPLAVELQKIGIAVRAHILSEGGNRASQDQIRAQIHSAIVDAKPDLVHANSLSMGRLAGPVASAAAVASVAHLRDIIGLSAQAVADLNLNTRLLAVSAATRDFHIAQGVTAEKLFVAYNGVDLEKFKPRPLTGWLHRELGLTPDVALIGTIGQLVLRKGHDVLAEAAQSLAGDMPHAHYVIIGERYSQKAEAVRHEAQVRERFSQGTLAGRVHFLGVRNDVCEILPELTLLVHPARQEPLGRVLLEAAVSGVGVVATDVGGTKEIFPPDGALLVPPDDPAALAHAMQCLLEDPALRRRTAAAALARAGHQFDSGVAAKTLASHYAATITTADRAG
jgi:glycosyltransferase involved in cell wall biosynthesis